MKRASRSTAFALAAAAAVIGLISCGQHQGQDVDRLSGLKIGDCIGHVIYPKDTFSGGQEISTADLTGARIVKCRSRRAQLKVLSTASTGEECTDPRRLVPGSLLYRFMEPSTGTIFCLDFVSG